MINLANTSLPSSLGEMYLDHSLDDHNPAALSSEGSSLSFQMDLAAPLLKQ